MELSTVKKTVLVRIDGKEYFLAMPKMRHQIKWDEILDKGDKNKGYAKDLLSLLEELGLPPEVGLELEESQIVEIIQGIGEARKKLQKQGSKSPDSVNSTAEPQKSGSTATVG